MMIEEIQYQYTKESAGSCDLSCGNNIAFVNITPGECILDLGCGGGAETIDAAKLTGPGGMSYGLDITPTKNADEFKGRGVHYCATCDGSMYQDRKSIRNSKFPRLHKLGEFVYSRLNRKTS